MNPLTLVKRIQEINKKEAALGINEGASWHAKYKDSAYVYVGGIPFDLTEGDLLAIFAQYGEIVDVNLIRDKGTGKSKGFAFVAYEDQRSTNLAVDNLNGAQIVGRTIRVDHVNKYKKLEEEDEETKKQKREERGICRAFQRGNCNRGDGCKFSHDEQRAANTGWGAEEDRPSRSVQDKFEGSTKDGRAGQSGRVSRPPVPQRWHRSSDKDSRSSHAKGNDHDNTKHDKRSGPSYNEPNSREEQDWRTEKRSRKYDSESSHREEKYGRERDNRSVLDRDVSQHQHRRKEDE